MSGSAARQVTRAGTTVLVGTLLLVGLGTAALLHERQVRSTDRTLLAAAHGHAHLALAEEDAVLTHGTAPVESWWVGADDPRVPARLQDEARAARTPLLRDVGDDRLALLAVAGEHEEHGRVDLLVAARLPRPTLARTVGSFAAAYVVIATAAAALAAWILRGIVGAAFGPLDRARDEAEQVVALGQGRRLTEEGPSEVKPLLLAVNRLLDRLETAHASQTRFTAEAAHELRTPVTAMLGELDVALRHPRTAEAYRDVLASQREEVERLARLVAGLTALVRLDAGAVERHREPVHARELVADVLAAERRELEAAGCAVRVVIDADPELDVHRALLVTALANLLRNAARHGRGADVVLRVGVEGAHAVFDVDDAGPGVPDDEAEALFGRFVRGGEARARDQQGLGLGLPLAREVARRHGGDCTLARSPSGGARARLTVRVPASGEL